MENTQQEEKPLLKPKTKKKVKKKKDTLSPKLLRALKIMLIIPLTLIIYNIGIIYIINYDWLSNECKSCAPYPEDLEELENPTILEMPEEPQADAGTYRETSAYTSEVAQTDSSPCISATGDDICKLYQEGTKIVASNAFPLGTKVYVEGYGEAVVLDRMNSRYSENVDVYFGKDTQRALQWGRKNVKVEVIS